MFKYLISINPLGFMYGSAGAFLSPENLVGRSGSKFPPEAAALAGLFFSVNKSQKFSPQNELVYNLYVAGPFWAKSERLESFYVPIPSSKIISDDKTEEWEIKEEKWYHKDSHLKPEYSWQTINTWEDSAQTIKSNDDMAKSPWQHTSFLHPHTQTEQRCTLAKDGLFLENAVQMPENTCLVYLSTHPLPEGWYRFGGENHLVEINSLSLSDDSPIMKLLKQPIQKAFALITPGVWGSNKLSYRYPKHDSFSPDKKRPKMLTERPIPYRYRLGNGQELNHKKRHHTGRLSRGRYAVPPGTVYVLKEPLHQTWWEWSEEWFPKEGFSLKQLGCGLSLPVTIKGVD